MSLFVLLAALPAVYWAQPVDTAPTVRKAGLERLYVPEKAAAAWRGAGFEIVPVGRDERSKRTVLPVPGLLARPDVASATVRPWVVANGWRFQRAPHGRYWYDLPPGRAVLAAAESFAWGADAVLAIDPGDLEPVGRMLTFLASVPDSELEPVADLAVVDDGSAPIDEVLNLLARHNLLFEVVRGPASDVPLTVRLGSSEFPREAASNPDAFALSVRRRLTDERRSLRLFGSEVVLGHLLRDARHARLHLLNYGGRTIEGLRVRLRGRWTPEKPRVFDEAPAAVEDVVVENGATEFSLVTLGRYAVIDLLAAD